MASSNDDIERLIAEMDALNKQADQALSGPAPAASPDRKAVARRPGAEPVPVPGTGEDEAGTSPALVRAVGVSAVVTAVVWVGYFLLSALPLIGRPGLGDALALFVASLLVSAFYTLRGRG